MCKRVAQGPFGLLLFLLLFLLINLYRDESPRLTTHEVFGLDRLVQISRGTEVETICCVEIEDGYDIVLFEITHNRAKVAPKETEHQIPRQEP